jgi:hypothetical protein
MNIAENQTRLLTPYEQVIFARKHYPNMPSDTLCGTLSEMNPEMQFADIVILVARVKNNQIH